MIRVCPVADLPRGQALRLDLDPPVSIFHTDDGELFAIDDTCTHQDASLADGWLEGCEVECPLHASRFDLRTGAVDVPPAKTPVRTHGIRIADGDIYLTVAAVPSLPADEPAQPGSPAAVPADEPAQPGSPAAMPADEPAQPGSPAAMPADEPAQPGSPAAVPAPEAGQP